MSRSLSLPLQLPSATPTVNRLPVPLAHQGGWDEILLVVAPLALVGLLLYVANKRVNAQLTQQTNDDTPETPGSEDTPA